MAIKLKNNRILREEFATSRWVIKAEIGTTVKDLLRPDFYSSSANLIKENDYIRVFFDDKSHVVDLLVLEVDSKNITPTWIKTVIINLVNISKAVEETKKAIEEVKEIKEENKESEEEIFSSEYEIKFRGPVLKFSIIRKSDKVIMQENISTKIEANKLLKELTDKLG